MNLTKILTATSIALLSITNITAQRVTRIATPAPTRTRIPPAPAPAPAPVRVAPTASINSTTVYTKMMALKAKYPHGMKWTDANVYNNSGSTGCYAFAMILMDAAFGNTRHEREYTNFNEIRIGDMLRINNDSHSVIVIGKDDKQFTFAEANWGEKIHWGRTMTIAAVKSSFNYGLTSYP